MSYLDLLKLCAPETIVVLTALVVLFLDLVWLRTEPNRTRMTLAAMFTTFGCVVAFAWMLVVPEKASLLNGMLVVDPLTQLVKQALLVLTVFTAILSIETTFTEHVGEFFALLLLATVGMMFLVSSEELLMIFVSLELTSLSLYILTAFNKHNARSAEAALKYFLFGGMAAAVTLFGMSLLYGYGGSTNLRTIANTLPAVTPDLLLVGMVMTVIGFGFKVAAVPFHLWAPDTYEGAPTPSAAFIASGSKVASFFILAKVMMIGFAGAEGSAAWKDYLPGWVPVIAILAALSLVLGNLAALAQSSVKRLLAYSAIAHAGYMLLGVMAHGSTGVASLMFYVITYALTTVGTFGIVALVEQTGGDKLGNFAGLSRRAPLVAFCLFILVLSLAGIPPLAGFFGKFYLFIAAAAGAGKHSLGLLWIVILALAMSCVSLYYYLKVLKAAYVTPAPEGAVPLVVEKSTLIVLLVLAAAILILGCFPNLLLGRLLEAVQQAGF